MLSLRDSAILPHLAPWSLIPALKSTPGNLHRLIPLHKPRSARYLIFDSLQSAIGSVNPSTCPEACQILEFMMILESNRPYHPASHISSHQASLIFFRNSTQVVRNQKNRSILHKFLKTGKQSPFACIEMISSIKVFSFVIIALNDKLL